MLGVVYGTAAGLYLVSPVSMTDIMRLILWKLNRKASVMPAELRI